MARAYEARRAYVCHRLETMGLPCARPEGAFYVFPSICSRSSEAFCLRLIQEAGVAAVPGTVFGTEGYIRLSYCFAPWEDLRGRPWTGCRIFCKYPVNMHL